MSKTVRDSNMEMLRIVCMLLIVLHHSTYFGLETHGFSTDVLVFCGGVGVNCFVLISGYYMVTSRITLAKMLKLWMTILSYSLGVYLVMCALGKAEISVRMLSRSLLPVTGRQYWFITAYVLLMLLSPFLNHYLRSISREAMLRFLGVLLMLFLVIPSSWRGSELPFFVMLYGVAAYVRLYGAKLKRVASGRWFLLSVCVAIIIIGLVSLMWMPESKPHRLVNAMLFWYGYSKDSVLTFLLSLFLFMGFASCKIGWNRWINLVATGTLGVYLLHMHKLGNLHLFIWNGLLHVQDMADSPWLLPYCMGASVLVFIACTLVDALRQQTLGRLYDWAAPRWILPAAYGVWGKLRSLFERLTRAV